jgi:phage terminase Nu1 subunit (DNA packaging protein)
MNTPLLNSWKEIAEYVGRGVRTVQRWERELGLPVRRPRSHLRSPVIAIPSEIDEWLRRGGSHGCVKNGRNQATAELVRNAQELTANLQITQQRATELRNKLERILALRRKSPGGPGRIGS